MTQLRSLLADVAEQARVYDVVERARTRSRRRRRVRQGVAAGTALVAVLATVTVITRYADGQQQFLPAPVVAATSTVSAAPVPTGPALPTRCTPQRLPIPDGYPKKAVVNGGDPTGRFIVGRVYPTAMQPQPVIWDNGAPTVLNMPGLDADLYDINSSGVAVGFAFVSDLKTAAYVYHDGQRTRLKGDNAQALAINESGVIVGTLGTLDKDGLSLTRPVVWRSPSAEPEALPLPPGFSLGYPAAIEDDGTIVGGAMRELFDPERVLMWGPDGSMVDVTDRISTTDAAGRTVNVSKVWDYRAGWLLVNRQLPRELPGSSYLFNVRTGEGRTLRTGSARLVNPNSWVVRGGGRGSPATIESAQEMVALPDLPGVQYGRDTSTWISSYSDDGRTIGGYLSLMGNAVDDSNIPVVWHCE